MRYSNLIKSLAAGLILLGVATGSRADFIDKWVNGFYYEGSTTPDPRRGLGVQYIPIGCLLYTSPSPRDVEESRMPSSA